MAPTKTTNEELIAQFESGTLAPESFHHTEHVQLAFLYLAKYPALEALGYFSGGLARFAKSVGRPEHYNETITWGFLLLIRERLARRGHPQTWEEFAASNPDLLDWKDNILKKYYQPETLASDLARKTFLFPDKTL